MINFFYHHFVMNFHAKQTYKFFVTKKDFNEYQKKTIVFAFVNFAEIVALIEKNLTSKWSFNEIAHLEKSLLIIAISEFYEQNLPKNIIISEAIKIIQKFSNGNSYAYINKILDNTLNIQNKKKLFNKKSPI